VKPAIPITHTEWQGRVVDLAHMLGWSHLHVRRSIGRGRRWVTATNVEGWPDLFLWREGIHGHVPGVAAIECKVPPDDLTDAQRAVLEALARSGVPCMVAIAPGLEAVERFLRDPADSAVDELIEALRRH